MAKIVAAMSMSLDGFVADPSDGVDHVFDWYGNGDVELPTDNPGLTFRTSATSARYLREVFSNIGAVLTGRRTFDIAGGWIGGHPVGVPVVVVTHAVPDGWPRQDSPVEFVTAGVEAALARAAEIAGDKEVGVAGGDVTRQCLDAGLVDEVAVDLVPVLLGSGIRFFGDGPLTKAPIQLADPAVVEATGVTHLRYRVR